LGELLVTIAFVFLHSCSVSAPIMKFTGDESHALITTAIACSSSYLLLNFY
jgi:hypothetical protein